jgi:hypothetical protein
VRQDLRRIPGPGRKATELDVIDSDSLVYLYLKLGADLGHLWQLARPPSLQ